MYQTWKVAVKLRKAVTWTNFFFIMFALRRSTFISSRPEEIKTQMWFTGKQKSVLFVLSEEMVVISRKGCNKLQSVYLCHDNYDRWWKVMMNGGSNKRVVFNCLLSFFSCRFFVFHTLYTAKWEIKEMIQKLDFDVFTCVYREVIDFNGSFLTLFEWETGYCNNVELTDYLKDA